AFLAACGSDKKTTSSTAAPATTTAGAATTTAAGSTATTTAGSGGSTATTTAGTGGGGGTGDVGTAINKMLSIDSASSGKGLTIDMGAVLALTGTGSFYGKTMTRGLDLAAKHIEAAGGPKFNYIYLDHKSGDAAAGQAAITELASKGVHIKFASYADDLGAMLKGTADNKIFTLDGGGGTSIFGQGQPYFWGTRAITPNDPLPGLFKYLKETSPAAKTVGLVGWDIGEPYNSQVKADILAKITAGGYTHNGLYELVTVGNQDFSQVLPKIKANEPDILLVSNYGQDPGSFANQASTADLKSIRIGFEFTPDGLNASKGTYDSDGYTFAYDYFDPASAPSPLGKVFVDEFKKAYGGDEPDFYAANFYEDAFVMWELIRRVIKSGGDPKDGDALEKALESDLTVVSVYGGDASTVGTFALDPKTHSVLKRSMGVFEYKGGKVTPKAFFDIGGAGYKKA
ncbi:MAG: amino acid/amide transporter substrate-binding protein family, partial [Ilumatobacteraceae bacterium]|nr:amino acid/amide transporter substrate-binding protein family [Ilumatobacteraceae bacterium]